MTQSIVIYTPLQDALYNQGMFIPLIGGMGVGVITFLVLVKLFEIISAWLKKPYHWGIRGIPDRIVVIIAVISIIAGCLTFHWLFN